MKISKNLLSIIKEYIYTKKIQKLENYFKKFNIICESDYIIDIIEKCIENYKTVLIKYNNSKSFYIEEDTDFYYIYKSISNTVEPYGIIHKHKDIFYS